MPWPLEVSEPPANPERSNPPIPRVDGRFAAGRQGQNGGKVALQPQVYIAARIGRHHEPADQSPDVV